MEKCKNCKYWSSLVPNKNKIATGECHLTNSINGEKLAKQGEGMDIVIDVNDDSGLIVSLITGENFGCTCWTLKP